MALAPEDEWEKDPELKAMRRDFVASFKGRRDAIEAALPALRAGGGGAAKPGYEAALRSAAHVAHKLAGAAESYGFPSLSRACGAIDEWYDGAAREGHGHDPRVAFAGLELVVRLLDRCIAAGKDSRENLEDPAFAPLEAAAAAYAIRDEGGL